jgi:hypothetical protein
MEVDICSWRDLDCTWLCFLCGSNLDFQFVRTHTELNIRPHPFVPTNTPDLGFASLALPEQEEDEHDGRKGDQCSHGNFGA